MNFEHIGDVIMVKHLQTKCLEQIQKYCNINETKNLSEIPLPTTDKELFESKTMMPFSFYMLFLDDYFAVPLSNRDLSDLHFSSCKRLILIFGADHNLDDIMGLAEGLEMKKAQELFLDFSNVKFDGSLLLKLTQLKAISAIITSEDHQIENNAIVHQKMKDIEN